MKTGVFRASYRGQDVTKQALQSIARPIPKAIAITLFRKLLGWPPDKTTALIRKYDANETRVPAGSADGGQWTSDVVSSAFENTRQVGNAQELLALRRYEGDGYVGINHVARGEYKNKEHSVDIANLDTLFEKVPGLKSSEKVWRGVLDFSVTDPTQKNWRNNPSLLIGKEFIEHGFVSTTLNKGFASTWNSGDAAVLLHYTIPKGAHVIAPDPKDHPEEQELLLPRDSKFKVVSIKEAPGTNHPFIITARWVGVDHTSSKLKPAKKAEVRVSRFIAPNVHWLHSSKDSPE